MHGVVVVLQVCGTSNVTRVSNVTVVSPFSGLRTCASTRPVSE